MKKDWKHSEKEKSTGLMLLACCSQVIILYVHHLNLAGKFFVGDIWRFKVELSRITPCPELPRPTLPFPFGFRSNLASSDLGEVCLHGCSTLSKMDSLVKFVRNLIMEWMLILGIQ